MAADLVGTGGQTHLIISEHYNFKKIIPKGILEGAPIQF